MLKLKKTKRTLESSLQRMGKKIRQNIQQGQKDLQSGKIGRNDYINPLKGTLSAAMGTTTATSTKKVNKNSEEYQRGKKMGGPDENLLRAILLKKRTKKGK